MVVMIVNTGTFEFIGLGNSYEEAEKGIYKRWEQHCDMFEGVDPTLMRELIEEESAQVVYLEPGNAVLYGIDDCSDKMTVESENLDPLDNKAGHSPSM
ncbi:hypothetical protein [Marinobacterium sp. BA1]|uniref:hypothetical protein n=1 Tax=Marinobacterium sp. BA1 TaxID=3138931 RepID=UPI0032E55009